MPTKFINITLVRQLDLGNSMNQGNMKHKLEHFCFAIIFLAKARF